MNKSIVLLSGGLDSATTLAIAREENDEVYALTFDYGQRHRKEVELAKAIADQLGVKEHKVMEIRLDEIGGSSLTDQNEPIPDFRDYDSMKEEIPSTYVPARNLILLGYALAWSEVIGAQAIYIGANSRDYSGYPDCRPNFYKAFQRAAELGTKSGIEKRGVQIRHPLINMRKADIIRKGRDLGVPFELTWSCYRGGERPCGKCDSCRIRLKGFAEAGLDDPLEYEG
ncbi:MAG: 7-cyano-7-deazaguanine synthase QueC [Thermoplasmata archaeon]